MKEASPRYVTYVIVLLTIVNVFNYADRMAMAVLLPSIKADLKLSDGQSGLLVGLAFSLFYALCAVPIARWADRGVRRNIIALAVAVWSGMTALCGAGQSFWQLFGARVGVAAGEAGGVPPAQTLICDYVPFKRRSGVFAIHSLGLYAGTMVGMGLAGALGASLGWRWTFVALGLPGIALAILVRFTLREPVRGGMDGLQDDKSVAPFGSALAFLWRCKTYRWIAIFFVVNGFVHSGLNQWWPSFYGRTFELSQSYVGVYLGLAIGAGSGTGVLLGGLLGNRLAKRDIRLPLMMGAAGTALALPAALGSLLVSSPQASMVLVALSAILSTLANGPIVAAGMTVTKPNMRATVGTLALFFTSVLGFGLGPVCVGLLSDALAPSLGAQSLRYALLAPVGLLPVLVVVLYAAARSLPGDLRAAGVQVEGGKS